MSAQQRNSLYKGMAIGSAILSQLVGAPIIGILLGRFLDNHFSTKPICFLIGFLLGIATGIFGTFHYVKELTTGDENQ